MFSNVDGVSEIGYLFFYFHFKNLIDRKKGEKRRNDGKFYDTKIKFFFLFFIFNEDYEAD